MSKISFLKHILPVSMVNWLKSSDFYKIYFENQIKRRKTFSQAGQDYWVINEAFAQKKNGYFVEIGSADGIYINNTYLLEKGYKWTGICIEANPNYFQQLKVNRSSICLNLCVDGQEGEVNFTFDNLIGGIVDKDTDPGKSQNILTLDTQRLKTTTLVNILQQYDSPKVIDYLSIDVEGAETRILKNFAFKDYIFLSITIERPSIILHNILLDNDYILVKVIPGLDSFYIHKSFKRTYLENQRKFYSNLAP